MRLWAKVCLLQAVRTVGNQEREKWKKIWFDLTGRGKSG
jgi:hypothetical protein